MHFENAFSLWYSTNEGKKKKEEQSELAGHHHHEAHERRLRRRRCGRFCPPPARPSHPCISESQDQAGGAHQQPHKLPERAVLLVRRHLQRESPGAVGAVQVQSDEESDLPFLHHVQLLHQHGDLHGLQIRLRVHVRWVRDLWLEIRRGGCVQMGTQVQHLGWSRLLSQLWVSQQRWCHQRLLCQLNHYFICIFEPFFFVPEIKQAVSVWNWCGVSFFLFCWCSKTRYLDSCITASCT